MNPPTIETDHLILRPFAPEDAAAYYEAVLSNPVMVRALPTGRPVPRPRARSIVSGYIDHWNEFGYGLWAVIERVSDRLLGHCGFQRLDQKPSVSLTYAINAPGDSSGLAVEAARACLRYAFETLGIIEVVAVVLPGNSPARPVYRRLGMRQRGKTHAYNEYLPFFVLNRGDFLPDDSRYHVTGDDNDEPAHD